MVNYYYEIDFSSENYVKNIKKIPDILEKMNNCLTEITGTHNPCIKIDMELPYPDNLPDDYKEAQNILLSYFFVKHMEMGSGLIQEVIENDMKWCKCFSQYRDEFMIPHIQIGGINGNNTISIRRMTNMSREQRKSLTDKMDDIIRDILKK